MVKFLDQAKIYCKAGDGGDGIVAFRREKFVPQGGPAGGDGGRGGSISFRSVANLNTLTDFRYRQHFKAQRGSHGMGKSRYGASGENLVLNVPTGTQIWDESGEDLLKDFVTSGEEWNALRGGRGGLGNIHFKSSTNQAPRHCSPGTLGEEAWFWLRLKLIADVGLLGLPNAGKSSLLDKLTAARPKVGDYPFTTQIPQLGVVKWRGSEFVLADIPGLIEGAHEGAGLGHRFLGHIERCSVLFHLVDGFSQDVAADYLTVRTEVEAYTSHLTTLPTLLLLTKADLLDEEERTARCKALSVVSEGKQVHLISSHSGEGLAAVQDMALSVLETLKTMSRTLQTHSDSSWSPL